MLEVVYIEVDKVAGLVVKIPNEDYWYDWRLIILMEIILKLVMGVVDMEVDKLADMLMKIPDEGFTDVNLTIDDTYGDDVRGGDGHGGWQGGKWGEVKVVKEANIIKEE